MSLAYTLCCNRWKSACCNCVALAMGVVELRVGVRDGVDDAPIVGVAVDAVFVGVGEGLEVGVGVGVVVVVGVGDGVAVGVGVKVLVGVGKAEEE